MYYIHKDHLGSIQSITDEDGELVEKLSFDPCSMTPGYGELANPNPLVELIPAEARSREERRRNADNWTFDNVPVDFLFDRGYTGHSLSRFFLDFLVLFYQVVAQRKSRPCGEKRT